MASPASTDSPAAAPASWPVIIVGALAGDDDWNPPVAMTVVRHGGTFELSLPQAPPFIVAAEDLHEAVTGTQRAYERAPWYRRRRPQPLTVDTDIGELRVLYRRPGGIQLDFPWTFTDLRQLCSWFGREGFDMVAAGVDARVVFRADRLRTAFARADFAAGFVARHQRLRAEDDAGMARALADPPPPVA